MLMTEEWPDDFANKQFWTGLFLSRLTPYHYFVVFEEMNNIKIYKELVEFCGAAVVNLW